MAYHEEAAGKRPSCKRFWNEACMTCARANSRVGWVAWVEVLEMERGVMGLVMVGEGREGVWEVRAWVEEEVKEKAAWLELEPR